MAPAGFYALNPDDYASHLKDNVPFLDVPELPDVQTAFYYRWRSYRKHIKPTPDGWVVTEFLPDVPWAGKYNTIPAAAGHHIMEGRWIHNTSYLNDYTTFWFRRSGNPLQYTAWFAWAVWQRHLLVGNGSFVEDVFPDLLNNVREWTRSRRGDYGGRVCYWQSDGADAMEVSVSGDGCRPTLESVMYGEAVALLEMAELLGNASAPQELRELRDSTRAVVLEQMWNPDIESFAVIPLAPPPVPEGYDDFNHGTFCCDQSECKGGHSSFLFEGAITLDALIATCAEFGERCNYITFSGGNYGMAVQYCKATNPWAGSPAGVHTYHRKTAARIAQDSHPDVSTNCPGDFRKTNETVNVRELLAFMPWYFSMPGAEEGQLIPSHDVTKYEVMWEQLFDPQGFQGPWGLRSLERRNPCYNYSWSHCDSWNGPSWPYETARVLTGAANVLNDYPQQTALSVERYVELLVQYAQQHTKTRARDDTAEPLGSGHIFEVLHPDDGYWINRESGYNDGYDYNHSTFIDLILSGLFGLRFGKGSTLVLNPLVPLGLLSHFAVDHVKWQGHYLSVVWDADGSHYGKGQGLRLFIDGKVAASADKIQKLSVRLGEVALLVRALGVPCSP